MFVSERDNGVRLAALNAIVVVYDLVGENVYKLIGPIADKDLRFGNVLWVCAFLIVCSLIQERIKRGSKKGGEGATEAAPVPTKVFTRSN